MSAPAQFSKICMDADDPASLARFWAASLDLRAVPDETGEVGLVDADSRYVLWFNRAAGPRTVKHRVHLDMYAQSLADQEALGSRVLLPEGDDRHWTMMADPEGGEYCAFLRDPVPEPRLHGMVVDSRDHEAQAAWWVKLVGGHVVPNQDGWSTIEDVPGSVPGMTLDFVPVPEPKSAPNRVHWDLKADGVEEFLAAGASLLRAPGGDVRWHVLADPEGNEFCVMPR